MSVAAVEMVGRQGHPRRGAPRAGTRGTRIPRRLSAGRAERGLCAKATFAARRSLVIAERAGGPVPPQAPLSSPRRKTGRSAACMPAVCVLAAVSRRCRCRPPLRLRRRAVCICARSRSGALAPRAEACALFPARALRLPRPSRPLLCAWTDLRGVPARSSSRWATPRPCARATKAGARRPQRPARPPSPLPHLSLTPSPTLLTRTMAPVADAAAPPRALRENLTLMVRRLPCSLLRVLPLTRARAPLHRNRPRTRRSSSSCAAPHPSPARARRSSTCAPRGESHDTARDTGARALTASLASLAAVSAALVSDWTGRKGSSEEPASMRALVVCVPRAARTSGAHAEKGLLCARARQRLLRLVSD
jgi:hypothetical protein